MKTTTCLLALTLAAATGSAFALERAHLVQPAELSNWWLVSGTGDPQVPSYGKNLTAPTCVAVSYRIDRGGATSQVKLEKMAPEGDLGAVAVNIVKGLTYTAAPKNIGKDPVYTYVVLPFNLGTAVVLNATGMSCASSTSAAAAAKCSEANRRSYATTTPLACSPRPAM